MIIPASRRGLLSGSELVREVKHKVKLSANIFWLLLFGGFSNVSYAQSDKQSICNYYAGAKVVTKDGKYLGLVASQYGVDSIYNEFGSYGSEYSQDSIWNDYGSYGSEYSMSSARNDMAFDPPFLIKSGKVIARLSTNDSVPGAVNPVILGITCFGYKPS